MSGRIILHTPEPASSPAIYVEELSRALTETGAPVHVICPANHQARRNFERNPLITLHASAPRSIRSGDGLFVKIFTNLRFLLSSCLVLLRTAHRGDIVHFQYVLHFPFGALFFACALIRGCSIVFTVHDPLPHRWLLPPPFHVLARFALAWSYHISSALLVHSEPGKSTLVSHFSELADKIHVVVHGPFRLGDGVLPIPQSTQLEVLLFGAFRENKGTHLAIEAIQQLHEEGVPLRLTIAGCVLNRREQGYWNRCREIIAKAPGGIRLIERFVPDEQLPKLFGGCHCFLLPYASFSSDSGVAFMALANGRAIISTKSGGLGPLLETSGGGLPIEEPTAAAVAQALRQAVALGPEHLLHLGRTGRAWVLSQCGWPEIADETRKLYEQLLGTLPA